MRPSAQKSAQAMLNACRFSWSTDGAAGAKVPSWRLTSSRIQPPPTWLSGITSASRSR